MSDASAWQTFLRELDIWIKETGTAYVPQATTRVTAEGHPYPLGDRARYWISQYQRGRLTAQQIADLESRKGWTWQPKTARSSAIWQRNFDAVRAFYDAQGSLDQLDRLDPASARWLRRARAGDLTAAQRKQLERIPGALVDRRSALEDFVDAVRIWTGPGRSAAAVPAAATQTINGRSVPIGRRARYFRERHAGGHLDEATVSAIESLPGWSWGSRPNEGPAGPEDVPS